MDTLNITQGARYSTVRYIHAFGSLLVILFVNVSCAPHSYEIRSAEVSPEQYKALSCAEIYAEMNTHLLRLEVLGRSIDKAAETDETQTTVGLILFWPVLFWLEGSDTPEAQEYAQIRGEMLSLEHTAILRNCEEAKALAKEWRQEEEELRAAMEKKKEELQMKNTYDDE